MKESRKCAHCFHYAPGGCLIKACHFLNVEVDLMHEDEHEETMDQDLAQWVDYDADELEGEFYP